MSLTGELKYKGGRVRSAGSAATDLPITLRGNHAAALHDTGIGYEAMAGAYADATTGWIVPPMEICELVRSHREKYVPLKRSLLVRVKMARRKESVELLCGCDEIGHRGLILSLPCTLDFGPGASCDLELFLTQDREPLPIRGTVRNISRTLGEDTIRYKVEVEFGKLSHLTQSELDAYVLAAKPEEQRPLLV
jgi:hypothetical protein